MTVPGGLAKPILPTESRYVIGGCPFSTVLETRHFIDFLSNVNVPVIHEGDLHWSTELTVDLRAEHPAAARFDV